MSLLKIFFILLLMTLVVLGQTILCPFFTIDDSDLLTNAQRYLDKDGLGAYVVAFKPGETVGRRYWPGFFVYTLFRIQLMGINSVLWHVFQVVLMSLIGTNMAWFTRRYYQSWVPGILAYLLLLTAGFQDYQTNWFSYVFTNSFEPIITLLLFSSAMLFLYQSGLNRRGWRIAVSIVALLLCLFAVTVKETVFGMTFGMAVTFLAFSFYKREAVVPGRTWLAVIAVFSLAWGILVYSVMPKDDSYGGLSTLNLAPSAMYPVFKKYMEFLYWSTGFYVFTGLLFGICRIARTRANWHFFAGALLFSAIQLSSVLIWVDVTFRLIFPAFAAVLVLSTAEYYLVIAELRKDGFIKLPLYGSLAVSLVVFYVVMRQSLAVFTVYLFGGLALLGLVYFLRSPKAKSLLLGCCLPVVGFSLAGLVVNGASHVASYPALYRTTEFTRHSTVRVQAKNTPTNGKVVWFASPGQEIFPYSCDKHAALLFKRPDLEITPASGLRGNHVLKNGDWVVLYGKHATADLKADAGLAYAPVTEAQYISSILSYRDFIILNQRRLKGETIPWNYLTEGTINMYRVTAPTWNIPANLLEP